MELVSGIDKAVVEAVAAVQAFDFGLHNGSVHLRVFLLERSGEDNAFALLDGHFKIARHQQVFGGIIAAFAFLRIVHSAIPVGLIVELALGRGLHIEVGITFVHTHLDAILDGRISGIGSAILVCPLADAAEGQEGFEAERRIRVCFEQGITNKKSESIRSVNDFLLQKDATDTINPGRHFIPFKAHNVFVTFGTIIFSLVLVQSEIKLGSMLNNRLIKGREQHMVLVVQVGHGHNQQAVIFSDVATYQCSRTIRTRLIRNQEFLEQAVLKICHLRLVKS